MWLSLSGFVMLFFPIFPPQAHCAIDCYFGLMNIEKFQLDSQLCSNHEKYGKEQGMNIFQDGKSQRSGL